MQHGAQVGDLHVADVMIPRLDMVAVDLTRPVEEVLDASRPDHPHPFTCL